MLLLSNNPSTTGTATVTTATAATTAPVEESETMTTPVKLLLSPPQELQPQPQPHPQPHLDPKSEQDETEPLSTPTTNALFLLPVVSSANRVFQIPELADNIALFLRPIYISQLRLVSRALYIAYRPHLRLHLHRGSTESWTSFPTLQHQSVVDTSTTSAAAAIDTKTADKVREKECDKGEGKKEEEEVKMRTQQQDNEAIVDATAIARAIKETETAADKVQTSDPRPQEQNPKQLEELHTVTPLPLLKPKPKAVGNGYGYEDGLTYGNLVETLTTDSLDNLERLIPILRQCPNITTLSITRWNKELQVFENLLHLSPHLKMLSVAFYTTVDLTEFLGTLTGTLPGSSHRVDGPAATEMGQGQGRGAGCGTLQSLDIKHRVPDINPIEWKALKTALDVLPSLRHLSLTGIEFTGGVDNNGEAGVPIAGINQTQGFAAILNGGGGHSTLSPWYTTSAGGASNSSFSKATLSSPQQQGVFPKITSLSLSICDCPAATMQEINRVFPKLTSLELNRCRSNWFQVFEPDPSMPASPHLGPTPASITSFVSPASNAASVSTATGISSSHVSHSTSSATTTPSAVLPRVPFPELWHLKLTARQGYEILLFNLDLVAHRPYLTSIEIYDMSLKIETLSSLVSVCKSEGRFLKRWAHSVSGAYMSLDEIQTYLSWDEIQTNEVPSLSQVQHLYVQKPGIVSFASTLTSLHIGDEGNFRGTFAMRPSAITTWSEILQKLPRLRILKIDQLLKGYCLFQHLGRQPVTGTLTCTNGNHNHDRRVCGGGGSGSNGGEEKVEAAAVKDEGRRRGEGESEPAVGSCETSGGAVWSIQVSPSSSSADDNNNNTGKNIPRLAPPPISIANAPTSTNPFLEAIQPTSTPNSSSSQLPSSYPTKTTTTGQQQPPKLETPFLEELHVAFEWDLDVLTTDLDRELIQRFCLLEQLFITSMRKPDDFVAFTKQTRPGLAIVHRRHENM
ncbi:hypothetical protein BGZ95_000341 [Linnemannia exigua]|uniref:F-box domain-containing protein n=1 Tax=Linnemannia exigua TaxID=604196 RepID=A0AAD4HAE2_9FUNG|nr:hypothetical protein BGZ95_000341 [Linnemannia exigua]